MSLFYTKKYIIIYILIIIFSFIKSQNDTFIQEKQLFNEYVLNYNNSVSKLNELTGKITKIKYNFIFIIKYNNLKKSNKVIENKITKIFNELNNTNFDKNFINEELNELNATLDKFDKKCKELIQNYDNFVNTKGTIIKTIMKILNYLIIFTIIVLLIVSAFYYFSNKKRKRYGKRREDYLKDDTDDNEQDNSREFYKLKVKKNKNYSNSRDKPVKRKKKNKKRIIKFI